MDLDILDETLIEFLKMCLKIGKIKKIYIFTNENDICDLSNLSEFSITIF